MILILGETTSRPAHRTRARTTVLDGVVDHKDLYLSPEEQAANDQFLPCCPRARTPRLVIDL